MNHVMVLLNEETKKMDIVLRWPIGSPIGPRLVKQLPMPEYPSVGYVDPEEALGAAAEFDKWLTRQEGGDAPKKPDAPAPKEKEVVLRPAPPPPPPPIKPKQADMFGDL